MGSLVWRVGCPGSVPDQLLLGFWHGSNSGALRATSKINWAASPPSPNLQSLHLAYATSGAGVTAWPDTLLNLICENDSMAMRDNDPGNALMPRRLDRLLMGPTCRELGGVMRLYPLQLKFLSCDAVAALEVALANRRDRARIEGE